MHGGSTSEEQLDEEPLCLVGPGLRNGRRVSESAERGPVDAAVVLCRGHRDAQHQVRVGGGIGPGGE